MQAHQREWHLLGADQRSAWTGFLRVHATVMAALDQELRDRHRLSLSEYDVLMQLSLAPEGALRMSDLADAVMLSRSGLTRLVERLERTGLLTRRPAAHDARATLASITDAGLARLAEATPTHLDGVRRLFLDPVGTTGARHLARAWAAIREGSRSSEAAG
ncbi:MarR family winged helix-turn-helix transcriptional regulator [Geodermatophilus sp. SYSU D01180]